MAARRGSFFFVFSERSLSVCTFYRSWIYHRRCADRGRLLRPTPMVDMKRRRLKDGGPPSDLSRAVSFFPPFFCADGFLHGTYWRRWCINVIAFAFRSRDKTDSPKAHPFFQHWLKIRACCRELVLFNYHTWKLFELIAIWVLLILLYVFPLQLRAPIDEISQWAKCWQNNWLLTFDYLSLLYFLMITSHFSQTFLFYDIF